MVELGRPVLRSARRRPRDPRGSHGRPRGPAPMLDVGARAAAAGRRRGARSCRWSTRTWCSARGPEEFAGRARVRRGIAGAIVPDLPPEEAGEVRAALDGAGLALVPLVAPTTPPERRREICAAGEGLRLRGLRHASRRASATRCPSISPELVGACEGGGGRPRRRRVRHRHARAGRRGGRDGRRRDHRQPAGPGGGRGRRLRPRRRAPSASSCGRRARRSPRALR